MAKVAVIYYSSTGTVHAIAGAVAEGAHQAGAQVKLARVAENAPRQAVEANEAWRQHLDEIAPSVPEATLDDLEWADAIAFGTPTRYGNVSAQLKAFLDSTGGLWAQGKLVDKAVTGFTSTQNAHGGCESTLLALYTTMHHWGCITVPPGYSDDSVYAAGGNPYGTSHFTTQDGNPPTDEVLAAARYQGSRLATIADRLTAS